MIGMVQDWGHLTVNFHFKLTVKVRIV